ncbi:MAG: ABC transporter permease [Gemmatimonadota bacterium]|nr:ABC transporter permease [Gemmatimonadota bacterium]MDE2953196.1 ABC transporter permease [Gemmatimonadota bacterium]
MFKVLTEMSLLGSYLKTAIRNLARHRIYSAINIIGLSIGLAFCILTYLFVHHEWTYDTFHENADRIYRVYVQTPSGIAEDPRVLDGAALREAFPEMQTTRFVFGSGKIGTDDQAFRAFWSYVDPNFLEIFSFSVIRGEAALQDKYSALITERTAQKYFKDATAIGKVLPIQRKNEIKNYTVTGIVKNVPKNSTLKFDMLLSFEQSGYANSKYAKADAYMLLPPNVNPNSLEQQFPKWTKIWWGEKSENQLKIQPLTQMHFDPSVNTAYASNPIYTYILSGIALLVLFIACVNFTTLTLGRQATRAREVGLRKVVGAGRLQIAKQFIGESLLLITIACIAGIAIAELALPTFNDLAYQSLSISDGLNFTTLAFLILLISLVGITAGGYPAFVLSRLQPTQIITSRLRVKTDNRFGSVLVIFQFALSIFFIIVTLMMGKQLAYLRTKPLGFQAEHLVSISTIDMVMRPEYRNLPIVFRDALQSYPAVVSTTWFGGSHLVNDPISRPPNIFASYEDSQEQPVKMMPIAYDVFKTLDIKLVAGREYSEEFPTDQRRSIIVNEALVEKLGIEDPVGKTIREVRKTRTRNISRTKTIIGVVGDFHFRSLHHEIGPVVMPLSTISYHNLLVRIHPENVPGTIAFMKEKWEEIAPALECRFSFVDENIDRQYHKEERWNQIIQYATGFAIFIAALGAFGLAALATTRRAKEIGIRKVLGASQTQILSLLSREFVLYITLSSLIAFPIAYYAANQWLQIFTYRTELGIGAFLLGSLVLFLIVLTTVITQTLKAARTNPVDALRTE